MGVSKPLRGIFAPFRVQPMSATFPRGFDPRLPLQPPAGVEIEYVSVIFGLQGILIVRANCACGGPPSPGSPGQARGRTAARDAVGKLLPVGTVSTCWPVRETGFFIDAARAKAAAPSPQQRQGLQPLDDGSRTSRWSGWWHGPRPGTRPTGPYRRSQGVPSGRSV